MNLLKKKIIEKKINSNIKCLIKEYYLYFVLIMYNQEKTILIFNKERNLKNINK